MNFWLRQIRSALVILILAIASRGFAKTDDSTKILSAIEKLNRSTPDLCKPERDSDSLAEELNFWTRAGYSEPEIKTFKIETPEKKAKPLVTHEFDLTLIEFKNSGWSEEKIRAAISKASRVYRQCGIQIGTVKLISANPPNKWLEINFDLEVVFAQLAPLFLKKPILYFVKSSKEGYTAFSRYDKQCKGEKKCNTAWITNEVNKPDYFKYRDRSYSVEAHELAHIFGNFEHIEGTERNIMSNDGSYVNSNITPAQCESIKKSPLMKKL